MSTDIYVHIKFSTKENPEPEELFDSPTDDCLFTGSYQDDKEEDSENPKDYHWGRYCPGHEDPPGLPGTPWPLMGCCIDALTNQ